MNSISLFFKVKSNFLLFILIFLVCSQSFPQWTDQDPFRFNQALGEVYFINSSEGWARYGTTILNSTDSGNNWNLLWNNYSGQMGDICFINDKYGWIAGEDVILKTTDGGKNWIEKYTGTLSHSVSFVDSNNGWGAGGDKIIKTSDGGETWSITDIWPSYIYSLFFIDYLHGWAVGIGDSIFKTTDSGINWHGVKISNSTNDQFYDVVFNDSLIGWTVGDYGRVLKTTDGGNSWQDKNTGTTASFYAVSFADENLGWAVGVTTWLKEIWKTTNGGESWFSQNCGTSEDLWTVDFPTAELGWIGGQNGTFKNTTDGGSTWSIQKTGNQLNSVSFINKNHGFAVGEDGIFLNTNDGGQNWSFKKIEESNILNDVQFITQDSGWVGVFGVMRTTDGGLTWIDNGEPAEIINSVHFINSTVGWAAGVDAAIYKTTNGGNDWQNKSSIHVNNSDVYFLNENFGWVCSIQGTILKTTNSGISWEVKDSFGHLNSIYFANTEIGWTVGNEGNIYNTTDGGDYWYLQTSGTDENLISISFADSLSGICVGDAGIILSTTNGGIDWSREIGLSEYDMFAVHFYDLTSAWVVGDYGTILKYSIPQLEIKNPVGGEYLEAGSEFEIEWTSYYINNLKIDYTTNNGLDWLEVISSTPAELKSFTWTVPWQQSTDCLLRIADVEDTETADTCSGNFTIHFPGEGWIGQNSGTEKNIYSIHFIDENIGWACGYSITDNESIFLRTINGGSVWDSLSIIHNHIKSIFFINSSIGFCVGGGFGEIYKTTDSGFTWVENISGPMIWYNDITFIDSDFGIVMGMEGEGNRTTDGGKTWSKFYLGYSNDFYDICFINSESGWAVGKEVFNYGSIIFNTTDGGDNWSFQLIDLEGLSLYSVDFINSFIGYAAGGRYGGVCLKTTDGGENWYYLFQDTYSSINSIDFIDEYTGWASCADGTIIHTTDGGVSWNSQPSGTKNSLNAIQFLNSEVGFSAGANGRIIKTENSGLPVELLSFNAASINQTVNLTWETATELNNYGFEVERQNKESGIRNSEWKKIGFVEGHGNSSSPKSYCYVDRNPVGSSIFLFRLKQIDTDGSFEYSEIVEVALTPDNYELFQNYPNPFNPTTTIMFSLVEKSNVVLSIYNILGERILIENLNELSTGYQEFKFDGSQFSSGVYFYSIDIADKFNDVKKMLLLK